MIDANEFFVAGGTLRPQAPSYVTRPADGELLASLLAGEFCYVLTPRQMGKSSMMVRIAQQLRERQVRPVIVDLTSIGSGSSDEWYLGLLSRIRSGLRLGIDVQEWWSSQELSASQRFINFLRDQVLTATDEPVTIFVDEIDSTLNLAFRDDFFAAIRALYNARAHEPIYARITFALLGVATPTELIQDRERTPFNIGHRIDLKELSFADARPLVTGLDAAYPGQGAMILARIFHWSAGHPYLTQRLCLQAVQLGRAIWDNAAVDDLVTQAFLSDEGRKDPNLTFIQDRILGSPPGERRALLKLYSQVYGGKRIADDDRSLVQNRLELYGLIQVREKTLQIRNEIYRHVFDAGWIKAVTPSNPQQRVAIYAVLVALLVVGAVVTYLATRPNPTCATFVERFNEGEDSLLRMNALAGLFDQGSNCRQDALRLFYGLDEDAHDQLFLELANSNAVAGDLETVVRNVYITLDMLAGNYDQVLLDEMRHALEVSGMAADDPLLREISAWLEGRRAQNAGQPATAVAAFSTAIAINQDHPVTHYDRARAYVALATYVPALRDLDETARIAQAAPPTSTPTPTPTPPITATPTADRDTLPATQGSTAAVTAGSLPSVDATTTPTIITTATATVLPVGSAYSQRFMSPDDILATVRLAIQDTPELYASYTMSQVSYVHLAAADITPPAFAPGDLVLAQTAVEVRRTPGFAGKDVSDVVGTVDQGFTLVITGPAEIVDGTSWWPVGAIGSTGSEVTGWVAAQLGGGELLLAYASKLPGTNVPDKGAGLYLAAPYEGSYGIAQLWGENPSFYSKFTYDGVALRGHNGIDFLTPTGTQVYAVDAGEVAQAGFEEGGFGNYVLLQHAWGQSLYGQLDSVAVEQGQEITRAQFLGLSGNTGGSSGPHLQFAIRINPFQRTDGWGGFSDPLPYLPPTRFILPPYVLGEAQLAQ